MGFRWALEPPRILLGAGARHFLGTCHRGLLILGRRWHELWSMLAGGKSFGNSFFGCRWLEGLGDIGGGPGGVPWPSPWVDPLLLGPPRTPSPNGAARWLWPTSPPHRLDSPLAMVGLTCLAPVALPWAVVARLLPRVALVPPLASVLGCSAMVLLGWAKGGGGGGGGSAGPDCGGSWLDSSWAVSLRLDVQVPATPKANPVAPEAPLAPQTPVVPKAPMAPFPLARKAPLEAQLAKVVALWQALVANTPPLVPCSYPWVPFPHPMAATNQMDKAMDTMVLWPAAVQAPVWAWPWEAHPPLAKLWPLTRGHRSLERLLPWLHCHLPWLRPGKIQDFPRLILWLLPQDYQNLCLPGKPK